MPLGILLMLTAARQYREHGQAPAYSYHDRAISRALSAMPQRTRRPRPATIPPTP